MFLAASAQGVLFNDYIKLHVPGTSETTAYGIDGGNIVGMYMPDDGYRYGFIAAIPEPATLSLLMLGGRMFLRRRC